MTFLLVKKSLGIIGLMFSRKCDVPIMFSGTKFIHTVFMNYPIDILFLRKGVVVDKCEALGTWGGYKSTEAGIDTVIEWEAYKFKDVKNGDKIRLRCINL